jgi:nitroreductase
MTTPLRLIRYSAYREHPVREMRSRAREFAADMQRRRSVRDFSSRPVPRKIIEECLRSAGSAPSGANRQPWHFVAVGDRNLKRRIREAAEKEEVRFYTGRAPDDWLEALAPLGTDARKPFLEVAPWLIAIFSQPHTDATDGRRRRNYYVSESVGIATGMLVAALHHAGLCSLTHTPSPMGFLNRILGRPATEKPFLLLVVGYPAAGVRVPDIRRKLLTEIVTWR